jgi:flagellar FliJ protein
VAKRFKLQAVLKYRQSLEDQAQQVLATSLQKQSHLKTQLQEQKQKLKRLDRELKIRQIDGLTIAAMDLYESQIQHHRRLIEDIQNQLQRLDQQVDSERKELLYAARERQVMEKLKDKQEAEYQQELSRKERAMLDEISLRSKGHDS